MHLRKLTRSIALMRTRPDGRPRVERVATIPGDCETVPPDVAPLLSPDELREINAALAENARDLVDARRRAAVSGGFVVLLDLADALRYPRGVDAELDALRDAVADDLDDAAGAVRRALRALERSRPVERVTGTFGNVIERTRANGEVDHEALF